jgi:hypothetical protein
MKLTILPRIFNLAAKTNPPTHIETVAQEISFGVGSRETVCG